MIDYVNLIALKIAEGVDIDSAQIAENIEIPPKSSMGDYAFPCFTLSKTMRKSPQVIAEGLKEVLGDSLDFVDEIEVTGGYLNFFLNKSKFIIDTIEDVIKSKEKAGSSDEGKGKTVLVEFSSPNIAKPFHVGHAFTTILGEALANIYTHLGYNTYRLNHLGDYGTQFGKLITAYKKWGDKEALEKNPIDELLRIYVKFHDEAKENPELEVEARKHFLNLENGAKEEKELWNLFKDYSLKEFNLIYERLGIKFDALDGESFYSDKIPEVVSILEEKRILELSEGAKVVNLDDYDLPPCIILKSDGTTIYASRDIAAILYRKRKYDYYKNIYVVGSPQALHFKQVFAVGDKMGLNASNECVHVGFGLVKFADMKFSTREGNIILQEELLNESIKKTKSIIIKNREERGTDMSDSEVDEVAEKVGIGAVRYTFCKNSRERDIVFSWDDMLNFDGDSAPYLMYTYARCKSVLRKARETSEVLGDYAKGLKGSESEEEYELIKLIYGFGESIKKAAESYEPYILIRQLNFIARAFNKFYNNRPILNSKDIDKRASGLIICEATAIILKVGMELIGIDPVERM